VVTCYGVDSTNFENETQRFKREAVVSNAMKGMVAFSEEGA